MMKALLLTVALLFVGTLPARADFFDDLGDALGKAADGVSDAARNVGDHVSRTFSSDAADPKQPANTDEQAGKPDNSINWNPPEQAVPGSQAGFFSDADAARPVPPPHTDPARSTRGPRRASATLPDDAPPPRAAPPRRAVSVVASLEPLPGFTALSTPPPPPRYAPASLAAVAPSAGRHTKPAAATATPTATPPSPSHSPAPAPSPPVAASAPAVLPVAVAAPPTATPPATILPVAVQAPARFTLAFGSRKTVLGDNVVSSANGAPPAAPVQAILTAVAQAAKAPGQRVLLRAEAAAVDGHLADARRRAFARAQRLQTWLTKAGVRFTQIDMKVDVASADAVTLDVYAAE